MQIRSIGVFAIAFTAALMLVGAGVSESRADQGRTPVSERAYCKHVVHGELFARTELFFGLSRPGGVITEEEFQQFVDLEVTARFPDGLTLLSGKGQFKDASGVILQEGSKLLILLYPFSKGKNAAVEEIRDRYKEKFQQQSVLRVDEPTCVSF